MDVARINLSHGNRAVHAETIAALREAMAATGRQVAIMFDTKGPEVRVGHFAGGKVILRDGQQFTLTTREVVGTAEEVSVNFRSLPEEVAVGGTVLLDDGKLVLKVEAVEGPDVRCRVVSGGELSDRKKVTLPGAKLSLPILCEEDVDDIRFGASQGVDFVAVSFVRSAADILKVRQVIEEAGGDAQVIAKIENFEGVENLDEILAVTDAVMVARGDMGVEFPVEEVPLIQKGIIAKCNRAAKPVVTATQMLESMITCPRPTRAEASDVANAILDGTDAVMLSAETASGLHPVEAVATMARIAERTDEALRRRELTPRPGPEPSHTVTDAISYATCRAAENLGAAAIITATQSGHTARMVAKYRPRVPILAATPLERVARRMRLIWGVHPLLVKDKNTTDALINETILEAVEAGFVRQGEMVVLTAGVPVGVPGSTNLLKVHTVGEILLRGTGYGQRVVKGRACVAASAAELRDKFEDGDVLVVPATDPEMLPFIKRAAAVISEEEGKASHAAVSGISLNVPVVVGAAGATARIEHGMMVTVDATHGLVYRGEARVL